MRKTGLITGALSASILLAACSGQEGNEPAVEPAEPAPAVAEISAPRPNVYAEFSLVSNIEHLSDNQRQMLVLLIEASQIMDDLFWRQAYGDDYQSWLASIGVDDTRRFAELNYGPWDRLDGEAPFIAGVGEKPLGARFYPEDMSKEEFEAAELNRKSGLYSFIRRNDSGGLTVVPYHVEFADELERAAEILRQAADLAEHEGFANFLRLRAEALITDEYQESDFAWMDVKSNPIELVIGAIENYEDRLFGYRAAYESYVLIKDQEWSDRLARFAAFLPELQRGLPVDEEYRAETPGTRNILPSGRHCSSYPQGDHGKIFQVSTPFVKRSSGNYGACR